MALMLGKSAFSGELCSKTWSVLVQQLRYGNRVKLKRPLPPHYNKARMLGVCRPVYPPQPKNCAYDAVIDMERNRKENPVEDNPYAVFLAGKMRRMLSSHPLVCVFHYNCYSQHDLINIRGQLFDMKFHMDIQQDLTNKNVIRMALQGTKWAPLIKFFEARTMMGFCAEADITKLMKALKKMPQFVLMAAVVQDRILHRDALEALERLKDITNVRAQLCSTLVNPSLTMSHNLMTNLTTLSTTLDTYSKQNEDTSSSSSSSSSDSEGSSSDSDSDETSTKPKAD